MKKFTVYCQMACLEEIYAQINKPIIDFLADESLGVWANLYKLLHEHSLLFVDITDDELLVLRSENPIINKLFKDGRIKTNKDSFAKFGKEDAILQEIHPQTLFFLEKTPDECKNLEEDFGMLFISKTELVQKAAWLFSWAVRNIQKSETIYRDWTFLQAFKHPCNSLVIADNYVLNKENTKNEENLLEVIKALLPKKLNKQVFHLTIIAHSKEIDSTLLEKHYKFLNGKLSDLTIFPYKIELTILLTSTVHDRNIVTNYAWFNSGFGFTIFKNKLITENTQIICLPFSYLHPNYKPYKDINAASNATNYENFSSVYDIIESLQKQYKQVNDSARNSEVTVTTMKLLSFQSSNDKKNRLLS